MSLFSYIDTRAPSTEEIKKIETEYDENGNVKEPTWLDTYEMKTEFSLQRLASLFGSLSIVFALLGTFVSIFLSIRIADGAYSLYSAVILLIGLAVTALVFALMRLAREFVNFMIVRLLQEEDE
ncbi:MAG: hypothetical protein J6L81_02425 [Clostridia bacterium]|nr:hypothetical protein [Clostridia bacterium]